MEQYFVLVNMARNIFAVSLYVYQLFYSRENFFLCFLQVEEMDVKKGHLLDACIKILLLRTIVYYLRTLRLDKMSEYD